MTQPRPDEESQIVIYPERFPERELDRQLKEELHNASELDPVLDSWYIQDSDDSTVELEGDSESSEEEEECFRCRGLFEDKTYPSVSEALRSVAASHNFYFEKELNEAKLDIYGRVASVNLLRKLVYGEGLAFEVFCFLEICVIVGRKRFVGYRGEMERLYSAVETRYNTVRYKVSILSVSLTPSD